MRRYLSQRAEFLGAVRLPNDAFEANAGTRVTIDILFLKKRDRIVDLDEDWIHLDTDENEISMNRYSVLHPEQLAGEMKMISAPFGMKSACVPGSRPFEEVYSRCLSGIEGRYEAAEITLVGEKNKQADTPTLPADPSVRNFSYTLVDGEIYFRENSIMSKVSVQGMKEKRIRGMIGLRDCTYELINMQMEDRADTEILEKQAELNRLYDDFQEIWNAQLG